MPEHPGWPARLEHGPVCLRPPRRRDAKAWSEVRIRNGAWLEQWEPSAAGTWSERNGRTAWWPLCSALRRAGATGTMLPFVLEYDGQLAGQVNAMNVVWGALRGASIGYWIDQRWAGRGAVPVAVALLIDHCFAHGLHRLDINIRPENAPSLRVVEKLGLRQEGYFERFLEIDGAFRDHLSFAITAEEVRGATVLSRLAPTGS